MISESHSDLRQPETIRFGLSDEMRAAFADVSPDEIERETDRILAKVRGESQVERGSMAVGGRWSVQTGNADVPRTG